jgi:hypothetical protein
MVSDARRSVIGQHRERASHHFAFLADFYDGAARCKNQ